MYAYAAVTADDNPPPLVLEFDLHRSRPLGDQPIQSVRIDDIVESVECDRIDSFRVRNSLNDLYSRFWVVRCSAIGFVSGDSHELFHSMRP